MNVEFKWNDTVQNIAKTAQNTGMYVQMQGVQKRVEKKTTLIQEILV